MNEMIATLAAFTYIAAVAAMALMWASAQEPKARTEHTAAPSRPESRDPYIICGQGYRNQEDRITMTRAITLQPGGLYVHISGQVYKCLRHTSDGCAVLMEINTGELLTVRGVLAYQDGKISYQIVESIRLAGAAV